MKKTTRSGLKKVRNMNFKKKITILSVAVIIVCIILLVGIKVSPAVHPTADSLIKDGLETQIKDNSMRGSVNIRNNSTIDLSASLGEGVTSDVAVATTGSAFVIDGSKMYINGSSHVEYSDLAEVTNYFTVYKDIKKNRQYVYYTNTEPGSDYMKDYENWAAIDTPKAEVVNFPQELRAALYMMTDKKLVTNPEKTKYTVSGKLDGRTLSALVQYMIQVDTKNTCLMNGIKLTGRSRNSVQAVFDRNRQLRNIRISINNARAGSTIKINSLYLYFTTDINKETLSIPKTLTDTMLDTDFTVAMPEPDIKNDIAASGTELSFDDLKLSFGNKDIPDFDSIKDTVTKNRDMDAVTSSDESNTGFVQMKTDANARVYFYTDPGTGRISQIEFDNAYANHDRLPVSVNGLKPGDDRETVVQIFGNPSSSTTNSGMETLTYNIKGSSSGNYVLTFTFYQGDALVNSGLQKINIKKITPDTASKTQKDNSNTEAGISDSTDSIADSSADGHDSDAQDSDVKNNPGSIKENN